jgi:hypothetical protein
VCIPTRPWAPSPIPGINNWNISVVKRLPVKFPTEAGAFELRGDFLNAFNHTQWGAADKNVSDATFGQITSTRPPRQIQVSLRYLF